MLLEILPCTIWLLKVMDTFSKKVIKFNLDICLRHTLLRKRVCKMKNHREKTSFICALLLQRIIGQKGIQFFLFQECQILSIFLSFSPIPQKDATIVSFEHWIASDTSLYPLWMGFFELLAIAITSSLCHCSPQRA